MDHLDCPIQPISPLFKETCARRALLAVFALLVVIQCVYLAWIGPGVGALSDGFSEANAFRAADAYLKDGIASHHGLPRQAYGSRFLGKGCLPGCLESDGTMKWEARRCLPLAHADHNVWVYTHYPEGPDVLLALMGSAVGLDNVRLLRLLPLTLCLLGAAFLFQSLARAFGADRAVIVAGGCVLLPMFHICMPGLHYEGYSFALLLIQMSLLIRLFWIEASAPRWTWAALFGLGFLQGWLSFDQFFVIALVAWPFWLMRNAEGKKQSIFRLALCVALPVAGFGIAHVLHLLQVAGETGSLASAILEFRNTAAERGAQTKMVIANLPQMFQHGPLKTLLAKTEQSIYLNSLVLASYQYVRDAFHPGCIQLSPTLPVALLLFMVLLARPVFGISLSGKKVVFSITGAALLTALLWLLAMPAHVLGNHHVTIRHLFIPYFFLLTATATGLRRTG